ncbi:hypothetical protein [Algiphilus sp.]|uniref:hypothetical protein n=1 Tax=Algiphilus sp. TaxID=1872431 RepID=UPI0025BBBE81|nr:hypothetical protein [Algiphilus sp.]MCK5771521.1 hypothetical protein [Algiphilus sp.]
MKVSNLLLISTVAVGALGGLYGCTEGDETSIVVEGDTSNPDNGNGGNGDISQNCPPEFSDARPQTADGTDVCELNANIVSDVTLTSDIIWRIDGRVTVGNGDRELASETQLANGQDLLNVTMTIEPGTHLVGADAFSPDLFSNLVITRGSRIIADGTADAPIVFSSEDDDFEGNQEWGGLILSGFAPHNACEGDFCNVDGEGNAGFIGGDNPDDSSGILRYVVLAEGGEIINDDGDEINGISFNAVGSGTTLEYIQVHGNTDDGIEFYGGTVDAKYVVLTANQDDSLDWDEGYQGNIQFMLLIQDSENGDHCIEADTFGNPVPPESKPTIANATIVCAGDPEYASFRMKEGTGGFFHGTVLSNLAGGPENCVGVEDDARDNRNSSLVFDQFIADCTNFEIAGPNKDQIGTSEPALSTENVFQVDAALNALYGSQAAEARLAETINWGQYSVDNYEESVADPSFFTPTNYLGAVDPDATEAWWQGWTLEGTVP